MPRASTLTHVTIVEDHVLFAEAMDVALTLEGHHVHRVAVDGQAPVQERLMAAVLRSRPHVVLLDLDLGPSTQAVGLIRPLTEAGIAVIVVTGSVDRASWGECLFNGARTVLPKSTPLNVVLATIRHIREGRRVLSLEERERLLASFHERRAEDQDNRTRLATLTTREREILVELMNGRQVRQIAKDYVVSEATVRTQVKSILAKLGVSSQLAAVVVAFRGHRRRPDSGLDQE